MLGVINFTSDTAVAPIHMEEILEFIYKSYLIAEPENFSNLRIKRKEFGSTLEFTALFPDKLYKINVKMVSGAPIHVMFKPDHGIPDKFISSLKENLILAVQIYHETVRQSTIYFAWVEGEDIIPEQPPTSSKRLSDRLFSSNMLFIYILFFGFNIFLFLLLGLIFAVAAIIALQLVIVLLSDKIYTIRNK
ncbi:MAG: hypothetical protein PHY59_06195 [Methanobacterium sp.]|nr:hypothetical protein [Methanobacterium sp.]